MGAGPIAPEILAAVGALELRARRTVREHLGGRWPSRVHGAGIQFAELREYVPGDDARTIDWNVSARTGRLQVKRFEEEREQTVLLALDASRSCRIGAGESAWPRRAAEVAALLGLAAAQAGDRVGALFFTERIEEFVPPRPGAEPFLALLARWLAHEPRSPGTDLDRTLRELLRLRSRPCLLIVVSDLHEMPGPATWSACARRHDLVLIALRPPSFAALPPRGVVRLHDPESGAVQVIDASDARARAEIARRIEAEGAELRRSSRRFGSDLLELSTTEPVARPIAEWTRLRAARVAG